jgi:hypothetical protein
LAREETGDLLLLCPQWASGFPGNAHLDNVLERFVGQRTGFTRYTF